MTEAIFALVPTYGVYLIFAVVVLSCLAVPLPSSLLVLASGGFVASEDMLLWQALLAAFLGVAVGDQCAFRLARGVGRPLLGKMKTSPKRAALVGKAESALKRWGAFAVFLSRTVLSPIGPYVSFVSGSAGLGWFSFSTAAITGAACWSLAYVGLGFLFADRISDVATVLGNFSGVLLGVLLMAGSGFWMMRSIRKARRHAAKTQASVEGM